MRALIVIGLALASWGLVAGLLFGWRAVLFSWGV